MSIQSEIDRINTAVSDQESLIGEIVDALAQRCVVTEPLLQARMVTPTEEVQVVTPDAGYDGLSSVTVEAAPKAVLQSKTVTPSKVQQIITPDNGYDGLSSVVVEAAQGGEGTYGWRKSVSRLPSGYTEVEYIESSGTQYINTGVVGAASINADFKVQLLGSGKQMFMETYTSGASSMLTFWSSSGSYFRCGRGNYTNIIPTDNAIHEVKVRQSTVNVDGKDYSIANTGASNTTTFKLFCEAMGNSPQAYGSFRLYDIKFYDGDTIIRNFVPCKNASGTAGLYDLVNGEFYTNDGSGTFAVGASSGGVVAGYVVSDDANAYPDGEFLDGYYYEKL